MAKLKTLLEDVFQERPKVNKHEVIEGVRNYQKLGGSIYKSGGILETAKQLTQIAQAAHNHILGEQDDWFDKVSVNRNMKTLKSSVSEFKKAAKESHILNQRLTGLYEDIGHVLNRYYEIDEIREDKGDMDNDGKDEPDDEEYMDNKDKAIKKAMKDESLDHDETLADKPDKEGKGRVNDLDGTPKTEGKRVKRLADVSNVVSLRSLVNPFVKNK